MAASLNNSDKANIEAANRVGITSDTHANITNLTASCYSSYFNETYQKANSASRTSIANLFAESLACNKDYLQNELGFLNATNLGTCYTLICTLSRGTVDPDLGGIGVFIS